jgi:uncharacterized protein involved in type VI secretion and phage assembly
VSEGGRRFYGKYRGTVVNNLDPMMQGRVQVSVPSVLGSQTSGWAMPCSPYVGSGIGFFAVPAIGANVWVEFEEGMPDHPILAGGFWGTGEVPPEAADPLAMTTVIKTNAITIKIDDTLGSVSIQNVAGMQIQMDPTGITLMVGSSTISVTDAGVSINDGALEVLP